MDLTPRQQKLIFVVLVVALAVLGVYLILPNALGSRRPSSASCIRLIHAAGDRASFLRYPFVRFLMRGG